MRKPARASRLIPINTVVNCANTPSKKAKVFAVYGVQGCKRRVLSAGVGSIVGVTVKKGPQNMKHKMYKALVVRQKAPYTRQTGKVRFEDNAVVILNDNRTLLKGNIRGPVAKEVTGSVLYKEIPARVV